MINRKELENEIEKLKDINKIFSNKNRINQNKVIPLDLIKYFDNTNKIEKYY